MKKVLTLLFAITMVSCTSRIDKKIIVTEYGVEIEKIKTENKEYSADDFATAAKEFDKYAFSALANLTKPLEITYKDLLEKAKGINAKNKLELANYNKSLDKLRKQFAIKVLEGHYEELDGEMVYTDGYSTKLEVNNLSNKGVTAYTGNLIFKNDKGEVIFNYPVEESMKLNPNFKFETTGTFLIMEDANLTELKSLPFSSLKTEWLPKKIIYEDGTRLESLPKPLFLM